MVAGTHILTALAYATPLYIAGNELDVWQHNIENFFYFIFSISFFSVFSDIDEPGSFIGKRLFFLSWPLKIFIKHRGFTHTLLFVFLCTIVAYFCILMFPKYFVFFFFMPIGVFLHMFGDMHTRGGVNLFWPISKKRNHIISKNMLFYTGGMTEKIVAFFYFLVFTMEMSYLWGR